MVQTEINNELKILVEKYINELQIIKSHINVKYISTLNLKLLKIIFL